MRLTRTVTEIVGQARKNLDFDLRRLSHLLGTTQISALITAVGAFAAAYSANEARKATEISVAAAQVAREMPIKQERYNQRLTGLREYTEAHGDYMTQLIEMADAMPEEINNPALVSNAAIAEMSSVARPATQQYRAYATRVNKARLGFSGSVGEQIMLAGENAKALSKCFRALGSRHLGESKSETDASKRQTIAECQSFYSELEQFDEASQEAISMMISELRAAWSEPISSS